MEHSIEAYINRQSTEKIEMMLHLYLQENVINDDDYILKELLTALDRRGMQKTCAN